MGVFPHFPLGKPMGFPIGLFEVKNPVDPYAARGNVELWLVEVEVRRLSNVRNWGNKSEMRHVENGMWKNTWKHLGKNLENRWKIYMETYATIWKHTEEYGKTYGQNGHM